MGIAKKEPNHLFREMIIINMFVVITTLQGLLKDQDLENSVLDYMHKAHFKELVEQLNFGKEEIIDENAHISTRYKEYQEAIKEKRGPNWLWPLTHHALNNLRGEETRDAAAMMCLTTLFSTLMKVLPEMISKYEVMKN